MVGDLRAAFGLQHRGDRIRRLHARPGRRPPSSSPASTAGPTASSCSPDDGLPVGYGTTFGKGDRQVVEIEVGSQEPMVADWLFEQDHATRPRDGTRERPRRDHRRHLTFTAPTKPQRARLSDHDFTAGTTYHRMRIDHTAARRHPGRTCGRRGPPRHVRRRHPLDCSRGHHREFPRSVRLRPRPHDEWIEALEARRASTGPS